MWTGDRNKGKYAGKQNKNQKDKNKIHNAVIIFSGGRYEEAAIG